MTSGKSRSLSPGTSTSREFVDQASPNVVTTSTHRGVSQTILVWHYCLVRNSPAIPGASRLDLSVPDTQPTAAKTTEA